MPAFFSWLSQRHCCPCIHSRMMNMRHRTRYGTFLNTDVWRFSVSRRVGTRWLVSDRLDADLSDAHYPLD